MSVEGRWTIRLDHAGNELAPAQPEPSDQHVPVVSIDSLHDWLNVWVNEHDGGDMTEEDVLSVFDFIATLRAALDGQETL